MEKINIKLFLKVFRKIIISIGIILTITALLNNTIPYISKQIFDIGITNKNKQVVLIFTISIILMYILKSILNYLLEYVLLKSSAKTISIVKKDIVSQIIDLPMTFYDEHSSSYILSRINEINSLSNVFTPTIFNFLTSIISSFVAMAVILSKSKILSFICILFIPILYIITNISLNNLKKTSKDLMEASAVANNTIHTSLEGVSTLKQLNIEESIINKISNSIDNVSKKTILQNKTVSKGMNIISLTTLVFQSIAVLIISLFVIDGDLTMGDYISLSQYIILVYAPVMNFQNFKVSIRPTLAAIDRINEILSNTEEITNDIGIDKIKKIEFKNISFKYKGNSENSIRDVTFSLCENNKLSIIGKNGSGKTTITKLLLGLYSEYEGNIEINDIDIRNINIKNLRSRIGVVPQNIYLFESSIYENIKLGNTDLTDLEINERLNEISKFNFLEGIDLDKKVIENGKNLSKGQIQKIALTRMLIKDVDVFIFDEATSNLDVQSRLEFKKLMNNISFNKLCIFINHDNEIDDMIDVKLTLNSEKDIVAYV